MSVSLPISNAQQQISALHDIGQILGSTTQFEDALNSILKLMCDQLDMSLGTVSLLSQEETQVSILEVKNHFLMNQKLQNLK